MSIKKQFLKSKPECKVTFKFEKKDGLKPESVKVIGDFNDWDTAVEPMKPLKSGDFTQTLNLSSGSEFQFRYLVDDSQWINDEEADCFVDNGMGTSEQNGVLQL
ncbi:isoamylase early set domain-containing protein [Plebeiibacterium marinum]|uniref:Isoamylase early set domain-containing protein n=1 Tax=Plebeiibacterium marinum TaxID=2992111 RepID=A0AAE3MCG4_9BACT|nr:isoamylase early set domain-containing protein [Plebeiobacterium marinum]MCW3805054.1 isoamylase early set domain-containing protein [Plebeiobacterium marinum]